MWTPELVITASIPLFNIFSSVFFGDCWHLIIPRFIKVAFGAGNAFPGEGIGGSNGWGNTAAAVIEGPQCYPELARTVDYSRLTMYSAWVLSTRNSVREPCTWRRGRAGLLVVRRERAPQVVCAARSRAARRALTAQDSY